MSLPFTLHALILCKVTPADIKHKQSKFLDSTNVTEILSDLCSELEANVDLASESVIKFELHSSHIALCKSEVILLPHCIMSSHKVLYGRTAYS